MRPDAFKTEGWLGRQRERHEAPVPALCLGGHCSSQLKFRASGGSQIPLSTSQAMPATPLSGSRARAVCPKAVLTPPQLSTSLNAVCPAPDLLNPNRGWGHRQPM